MQLTKFRSKRLSQRGHAVSSNILYIRLRNDSISYKPFSWPNGDSRAVSYAILKKHNEHYSHNETLLMLIEQILFPSLCGLHAGSGGCGQLCPLLPFFWVAPPSEVARLASCFVTSLDTSTQRNKNQAQHFTDLSTNTDVRHTLTSAQCRKHSDGFDGGRGNRWLVRKNWTWLYGQKTHGSDMLALPFVPG